MSNVLVLCDHAPSPENGTVNDIILSINYDKPEKNIRIEIENITHAILRNPSQLALDLLDIAAYIYHADSSVKRGTNKDTFNVTVQVVCKHD